MKNKPVQTEDPKETVDFGEINPDAGQQSRQIEVSPRTADLPNVATTHQVTTMDFPEEWGIAVPKVAFVTTFDLQTQQGKDDCYDCLSMPGKRAKLCVGKRFNLVGILVQPAQKNLDNGEIESMFLCRMLCDDGALIGTRSEWIIRSLQEIGQYRGEPPTRAKPWPCEIIDVPTSGDKSVLKVRYVRSK